VSSDEVSMFTREAELDAGAADDDVATGKGLLELADADKALERLEDKGKLCETLELLALEGRTDEVPKVEDAGILCGALELLGAEGGSDDERKTEAEGDLDDEETL
jgi:hypothetical protein